MEGITCVWIPLKRGETISISLSRLIQHLFNIFLNKIPSPFTNIINFDENIRRCNFVMSLIQNHTLILVWIDLAEI